MSEGDWGPWHCRDFSEMSDQDKYVWAHGYASAIWDEFNDDNIQELVEKIDEDGGKNPDSFLAYVVGKVAQELTGADGEE